jgi:hypothetical protein
MSKQQLQQNNDDDELENKFMMVTALVQEPLSLAIPFIVA